MLSLVLWATLVQPVNVAWGEALRSGPEAAQAEYMRLRGRWEYGHVAAFLAWLVGLCLLIRSVLVETPRGGTIERAARLSIAACCMLSGIACGGDGGMRMEEEAGRDTVGVAEGGPVREDEPTRADTMVMQVRGSLPRRPVAPSGSTARAPSSAVRTATGRRPESRPCTRSPIRRPLDGPSRPAPGSRPFPDSWS